MLDTGKPMEGRTAIEESLSRRPDELRSRHVISNVFIDVLSENEARGISYLTLYGFSSENWKRPIGEVDDLMGLLRRHLQNDIEKLAKEGVRLCVIGERERLPIDIVRLIGDAEQRTSGNHRITVAIAISYGSRQEIAAAARRHGKALGAMVPNPAWAADYKRKGFEMIAAGPDQAALMAGVANILEGAK